MLNPVDIQYRSVVEKCIREGRVVNTRNSECRRVFVLQLQFWKTPLVSVRKTAWKNALREWEWFMSGSCRIDDLHESVRPWWKPFCTLDGHTLPYNYGKAMRRIYAPEVGPPIEVSPSILDADPPADVPRFPRRDVSDSGAKHVGHVGINAHGDGFRVVEYLGDGEYIVQFDSNGYCAKSRPTNFLRGIIKNPYYPTVLGVGCYGEPDKVACSYHERGYRLWSDMMNRCYNPDRRHYQWYKDVKVAGRWKVFEYFLYDLSRIPGFEEWLAAPGEFSLDKDYRKANYYGPNVCVFLPDSINVGLANAERFYPVPRRPVELDQVAELIDGIKNHPFSRRHCITTWIPSHVHSGLMNPTNCHGTVIQAFVNPDDSLHLVTYQRSADVVCGLPHNWVQYWAFLVWLAHRGGRKVGSLTWIGGDVHVYKQHYELADRINKSTQSVLAPNLVYTPSSDDFKADDFTLDGPYNPVLTDRAEMVV